MRQYPSLPINRCLPTLVVAALVPWLSQAQVPGTSGGLATSSAATKATPAKDEPPTEAEILIDQAAEKLRALTSVEADLLQTVSMLGQNFEIRGSYLRGPGNQIRLELNLAKLANADGTMLQICDGKTLWNYQKVLDTQTYEKLEVGRILQRLNSPEFDEELRSQVIDRFGFTGPDALLVNLRKVIHFDQKEEDELDGKKVWVVRGTWKDRAALSSGNQPPVLGPLPPYVPSVAAVTIGQDDGWPYRVTLRGRPRPLMEAKTSTANRPQGRQDQISDITLQYKNVRLNPDLDAGRFAFQVPSTQNLPGVTVVDQTEEFLAFLERAAQATLQARKAESTKPAAGDLGTIDQTIPVPVPRTPGSDAPGPKSP